MKHILIKLAALLPLVGVVSSCAATKHHPQHVQVTETHTKIKTKVPACRRVKAPQAAIIQSDSEIQDNAAVHVLSMPAKVVQRQAPIVTHVAAPAVRVQAPVVAPAYKIDVPAHVAPHYEINVPQSPAPEYVITLPQGAHPKLKVVREAKPAMKSDDVKVVHTQE